jgi:hypothetical protein
MEALALLYLLFLVVLARAGDAWMPALVTAVVVVAVLVGVAGLAYRAS